MKVFGTDYDGVIINIEPQKAKAFGLLLNKHWGVETDQATKFWLRTGGMPRRYKFDFFYEKQFSEKLSNEDYNIIESEYSRLLKRDFYPNLELLPGALELLNFARKSFDHTFISSGVPMEEINYLVSLNSLKEYFDLTLGTSEKFSTKKEHFKEVKSEWNPETIIFVADSPEDMKIAKKNGAVPLGVLTNHTKKELMRAGAWEVCDLSNAVSLIRNLL